MTIHRTATAATVVDTVNGALTAPRDRECITCYLHRMLVEFGCTSQLRWALRWRDRNAPRAATLARRLMDRDGFCGCEVLFHVFPWTMTATSRDPFPPCLGVKRRGSINPCRPRPAA